jgi:hypothetical protein
VNQGYIKEIGSHTYLIKDCLFNNPMTSLVYLLIIATVIAVLAVHHQLDHERHLPHHKILRKLSNKDRILQSKIYFRLYQLVRGDIDLANRLIFNAKRKYPGKTEKWYWEKVIYDLERDR